MKLTDLGSIRSGAEFHRVDFVKGSDFLLYGNLQGVQCPNNPVTLQLYGRNRTSKRHIFTDIVPATKLICYYLPAPRAVPLMNKYNIHGLRLLLGFSQK